MPTQHNRRFAAAQRRLKVTEYYLKGWSQAAIATELGVSQGTISGDLKYVHRQWENSAIRNFDVLRMRELQKLDSIEREGWSAWERSQKPAQSAVVTGEGKGQQTKKSMKNQTGDPRFLDLISKCIAQRRALTGLDAPILVADATPPPAETPEQRREKLAAIFNLVTQNSGAKLLRLPPGSDDDS